MTEHDSENNNGRYRLDDFGSAVFLSVFAGDKRTRKAYSFVRDIFQIFQKAEAAFRIKCKCIKGISVLIV